MKPGDRITSDADWDALPDGATVWTPTESGSGPDCVLGTDESGRVLGTTSVLPPSRVLPHHYVLATMPHLCYGCYYRCRTGPVDRPYTGTCGLDMSVWRNVLRHEPVLECYGFKALRKLTPAGAMT